MNLLLLAAKEFASVYLNNILLHSVTPEVVWDISENPSWSSVHIKLDKCTFLAEVDEFLGFEISGGTVRPGSSKSKAVKKFLAPNSVYSVRQRLGLTNYFEHFVEGYARIAKPLTRLTKKNVH